MPVSRRFPTTSDSRPQAHHAPDDVGPGTLLVDQRESGVEVVGNRCRTASCQQKYPPFGSDGDTDRLAPPASGETMTQSSALKFSLM
jgi:hypothetical protein